VRAAPLLLAAVLSASPSLSACKRDNGDSSARATAASSAPSSAAAGAGGASGSNAGPLVLAPANQIRWTEPPPSTHDVALVVRESLTRAKEDGRTLIVYVGATWCEPCQRFHHAVERGELDTAFPKLTVLAFDADRDGEALATAGYASRLIPLFAIPRSDGRASGRTIEGSVKGEEAVSEITPRLRALIAGD
jgi:thiol-disulfide isomerase/thioredoxin